MSEDNVIVDPDESEDKVENPVKEIKKFTQAEMNKVVGKERQSLMAKHSLEIDEKDKLISSYEAIVKKDLETKIQDLPEPVQKIVSKLTILQQIDLLQNDQMQISKKLIPSTEINEDKVVSKEGERDKAFSRFKK